MGGFGSGWFTMQRPHSSAEFAQRGLRGRSLSAEELADAAKAMNMPLSP